MVKGRSSMSNKKKLEYTPFVEFLLQVKLSNTKQENDSSKNKFINHFRKVTSQFLICLIVLEVVHIF